MTKQGTIEKFRLYMDDTSELSSTEESDLYDKVYKEIWNMRPWVFAIRQWSGTTSGTDPFIALPSDYSRPSPNFSGASVSDYAEGPVVFVGPSRSPYKLIPFESRRAYFDQDGYAYVDMATDFPNKRIAFTKQPAGGLAVELDYVRTAPAIILTGTPVWDPEFPDIIYHGMCVDNFIIQQSDKAKSYLAENQARYTAMLDSLAGWNASFYPQF
jgi:hypothetical protein